MKTDAKDLRKIVKSTHKRFDVNDVNPCKCNYLICFNCKQNNICHPDDCPEDSSLDDCYVCG